MIHPRAAAAGVLLSIVFGPIIWAVYLLIVYASHATICEAQAAFWIDSQTLLLGIFGVATMASAAAMIAGLLWPHAIQSILRAGKLSRNQEIFVTSAMRLMILLASLGLLWSATSIALLPVCLQLR